ncbi:MAG TPA: DNA repair protein RadA [Clostridiales bacterium]|nr:DNA repair protein RadA [Clostridiales bacterium]
MAKNKARTVFVCQQCGYESPKWSGQCICGAWNTMVEETVVDVHDETRSRSAMAGKTPVPRQLHEIRSGEHSRINTGIGELNRVLGGGLVQGSLTLISGEPGIGKSTLILQAAACIGKQNGPVLYVTGEESEEQIRIRSDRVCRESTAELYILAETNLDLALAAAEKLKPAFLIIDSIQTMYSADLTQAPGSVGQVRACAARLMNYGKGCNVPIFIVAHVTKSGDLAGPKIIEHLVDCVLQFTGERDRELRILRAHKNRFGTTSEIGAFDMNASGLVEIPNLSASFLEDIHEQPAGSITTGIFEGTRPFLLEIQALTSPVGIGFPRRTAIGVETARLNMILAVLDRKAGISLSDHDVYVNVVGGIKADCPSVDLAVALAIVSGHKGKSYERSTLAIGEIGLTGELRMVMNADKIVGEAARLGFSRILLPQKNYARLADIVKKIELIGLTDLRSAVALLRR